MPSEPAEPGIRFRDLELPEALLRALDEVGYETPSPVQAQTIPHLLQGRDMIGQAQTGTGKTAAFALPALARTDLFRAVPQTLVLAPTRELAIQVAEAFQRYATHLSGFRVLPIYGGQSFEPQLKGLRRGVHVVVGTPGRVVDHLKRGTLKLDGLRQLVLDEADEMLRMGFIEDVEWILQQTPPERQVALFSATLPAAIKRVAQTYLKDAVEVQVQSRTATAANVRQRWWMAAGASKLDALTRILEAEPFEAMIVFARTKIATVELAEKLEARGFNAAALNGDLEQKQRERIVGRLRDGSLDIVVATDVAARGLDVERISHVINYDVPTDTEAYVHRIGRTGRAGRSGEAILFVAPRERHWLKIIERATRQAIAPMQMPTEQDVLDQRAVRLHARIVGILQDRRMQDELSKLQAQIERLEQGEGIPATRIAAALATLVSAGRPRPGEGAPVATSPRAVAKPVSEPYPVPSAPPAPKPVVEPRPAAEPKLPAPSLPAAPRERPERRPREARREEAAEVETFRVEVGARDGVKPANLVGAIANEADLDSAYIGRIEILDDHSLVELPVGMPKAVFRDLQKVWVSGRQLRISRVAPTAPTAGSAPRHKPRRGG